MKKIFLIALVAILLPACSSSDKRPLAQAISYKLVGEMTKGISQHADAENAKMRRELALYQQLGCLSPDSARAMGYILGSINSKASQYSQSPQMVVKLSDALEERFSYSELQRLQENLHNNNAKKDPKTIREDLELSTKAMGVVVEVYMGNTMSNLLDPKNMESMMSELASHPDAKAMMQMMESNKMRDEMRNVDTCVEKATQIQGAGE